MNGIGTLYGIGVGPGDPELLTLKAARVLKTVAVVFAASSSKNDHSIAQAIVAPHLRPGAAITRLPFPMTRDRAALDAAWQANAAAMADVLAAGRDAAFITLGDPLLYSTFGYILPPPSVAHAGPPDRHHPGNHLVSGGSRPHRDPPGRGRRKICWWLRAWTRPDRLERALAAADNAVILKTYRRFPELRQLLVTLDLARGTTFVTRLGLPGEAVERDLERAPEAPPYLSLCLVKRPKE